MSITRGNIDSNMLCPFQGISGRCKETRVRLRSTGPDRRPQTSVLNEKGKLMSNGYSAVKISVKRRKKFIYVYTFVSFGLEHSKAPKATYNMVHTGYSGDLSGLERD